VPILAVSGMVSKCFWRTKARRYGRSRAVINPRPLALGLGNGGLIGAAQLCGLLRIALFRLP
jgi:hypothetical protein